MMRRAAASPRELRVGDLLWVAAGLLFISLRLPAITQMPVGGAELAHLSGALRAADGATDDRFVPTLFQSIVALLLSLSDSEVAPRIFAVLASATVPFALYRVRVAIGEAGALIALAILAVDPPSLAMGTQASALALDIPLALWTFALIAAPTRRRWMPVAVGFLLATAGPLPLPLLAALAILAFSSTGRLPREPLLLAIAGAAAGIVVATLAPHSGGFTVPPVEVLSAGFEEAWSTTTTLEASLLYSLPLLVAGAYAAALIGATAWQARRWEAETDAVLAGWAVFAMAWWVASAGEHSVAPAAALTLPLALLAGPVIAAAVAHMLAARWDLARYALPVALFAAFAAASLILDWARVEQVGSTKFVVRAITWGVIVAAGLAVAAWRSGSRWTLVAPGLVAALALTAPGTVGVAFSGADEPLPSPRSTAQAHQLAGYLQVLSKGTNGDRVLVATELRDAVTWPFRTLDTLQFGGTPGDDVVALVLPAGAPRPAGFAPLSGNWVLQRAIEPPRGDLLEYIHWLMDRNTLSTEPLTVVVYTREGAQ